MLNQNQLQQFKRDGFLVVENVLDSNTLQNLQNEYATLVDRLADKFSHSTSDWQSLNFEQKITHLIACDADVYEHIDISLPLKQGLDESAGVHTGPSVFELLTHQNILDIVESIIGPEIYSNPVQHVRIKPPEEALNDVARGNSNLARTGWHQDAAVIVEEAESSPILTVWVAVTDATPEMGCMQAVAGSHQWQSTSMHCPGRSGVGEIFIPAEMIDEHETVNLAVKAGGLVLLNKQTWHGAGPNRSDRLRWSFDLRYQPPGYNTGRECFPGFLARSTVDEDKVLTSAAEWQQSWATARTDIAQGTLDAVFNERWNRYRNDPLCA